MKNFKLKLRAIWTIVTRNTLQQATIIAFAQGTFKRSQQEGGHHITETLAISLISGSAELYRVQKTISRQQRSQGRVTMELEHEEWKAVYDCSTRQLVGIGNSRKCTFIPEQSMLLISDVAYAKQDS